jgi:hypothetical protein
MHHHQSLSEHLRLRAEQGHQPVFTPCCLGPLVEFDQIFSDMDRYSFDVNKFLSADATAQSFTLTSESIAVEGGPAVIEQSQWSAVWPGHDPQDGFAGSPGSVFTQSAGNTPLPEGPRTSAFLLLVTTDFVHLSADKSQTPALVRGALNEKGDGFDYVVLDRSGTPDS